jgi:hypothetical protein
LLLIPFWFYVVREFVYTLYFEKFITITKMI